jgi:hypothetical protein
MTNTTTVPEDRRQVIEAREKIAVAAGFALLVAAVVLLTAVLPAEYGIDPFGTGEKLGLLALAEAADAAGQPALISSGPVKTTTLQSRLYKVDSREFQLAPSEGMEFKYHIEKGGGLLYTWTATANVEYEFHGEPQGGPAGAYESYDLSAGEKGAGNFTAPFTGIHGWYWLNKTPNPVTVKLTSAGFYTAATEFRKDKRTLQHQLPDVNPATVSAADK